MSVGRNDPCPCGSGKKYKKCCLVKKENLSEDVKVITDNGSLWNMRFIKSKSLDYFAMVTDLKRYIFKSTLAKNRASDISNVCDKEQFLKDYLLTVESEMQKIIYKYDLHELFFWVRRISPENVFNRSELTILLYRETLMLGLQKYGKRRNILSITKSGHILPKYIVGRNPLKDELNDKTMRVLADAYKLETLSMLYVNCTQIYRCLIKGGQLIAGDDFGFDIVLEQDLSDLINLYDERLKHVNILSTTGSYVPISPNDIPSLEGNVPLCLGFVTNVDKKSKVPLITKEGQEEIESNYFPLFLNLRDYYEYLKLFDSEFTSVYGFSADTFIEFLNALSRREINIFFSGMEYQYNLLQRAYVICRPAFLLKWNLEFVKHNAITKESFKQLKKLFPKILKFLTCNKQDSKNIDLWTRGPRKIFFPITWRLTIIDYSGIISMLDTLLLPIARKCGESGNKKSGHFEIQCNGTVIKEFGEENFWIGRKQVKNSKNENKEIDSSFRINKYLFILECKSINVSFGFDKGDKKSLEYRKTNLETALKAVENKAEFIATNYRDLYPALPRGVHYIVPLVVSPFPEYIWEKSEYLFLEQRLPRILTLNELKEIKRLNLDNLKSKIFTLTMN